MKYAKILMKQLANMPSYIQKHCILYKNWKHDIRISPSNIADNWKSRIFIECRRLDEFLFSNTCGCSCSLTSNNTNVATNIKLKLCEINSETLYKICKKLQKKLKVPAMDYYKYIIENKAFDFIASARKTMLILEQKETVKCTHCDWQHDYYIIMRCGHYICKNCAFIKWNLKGAVDFELDIKELQNAAHKIKCPECSCVSPLLPNIKASIFLHKITTYSSNE